MKWKEGPEGGGYLKHCFFKTKWLDCLLIKFPNSSKIDPHIDPCNYGDHYRFNVELKTPESGGYFCCEGGPIMQFFRWTLFRPDIQKHWVSEVKGEKMVFSVGWVIPRKKE